tara:strand:+ start:48 stop:254 length:207 start_codon:yes stop_codon:yes gene_type:complete
MTKHPFPNHRAAALALLNGDYSFTRKAAQFLGQIAVDPTSLSQSQREWLAKLLDTAGLPPLSGCLPDD